MKMEEQRNENGGDREMKMEETDSGEWGGGEERDTQTGRERERKRSLGRGNLLKHLRFYDAYIFYKSGWIFGPFDKTFDVVDRHVQQFLYAKRKIDYIRTKERYKEDST